MDMPIFLIWISNSINLLYITVHEHKQDLVSVYYKFHYMPFEPASSTPQLRLAWDKIN